MKTLLLLVPALALVSLGCATTCPPPSARAPDAAPPLCWFSPETGTAGWDIEDDVVMGGRSRGRLAVNEAGNALFTGEISLANGGGFSSIQRDFDPVDVSRCRALFLGLKGDGKRYQLRVESEKNARHAYAFDFGTSGDWQQIEVPFADMYPIRHGDRLDLPNYPGQALARIQILIGTGRAESFQLELDRIWVE